jgi:predicted RecB family endonuclease
VSAVRVALDLEDDFHQADMLVCRGAQAAFRAAAEPLGVELLFTSDGLETWNWQFGSDPDDIQAAYDALHHAVRGAGYGPLSIAGWTELRALRVDDEMATEAAVVAWCEARDVAVGEVGYIVDRLREVVA